MEPQIIKECEAKMQKSIAALEKELGKVRTGRASLALLDDIRVDYYGTPSPLNLTRSAPRKPARRRQAETARVSAR